MLVNHVMREGDRLTVTELKRFGRNYVEIYHEWQHITKEQHMDIRVADMPILDTSKDKNLMGQVISDVVLALLSYVAESDWQERHELQRQGIEVAKEQGRHMGQPRVTYPDNWEEWYGKWKKIHQLQRSNDNPGTYKRQLFPACKKWEENQGKVPRRTPYAALLLCDVSTTIPASR